MSHSARIVHINKYCYLFTCRKKNTLFTFEYKIYVQDMEVNNRTRINSPFLMVESSLRY